MPGDQPVCFIVGPIGEAGSAERKSADLLRGLIIDPVAEAAGYSTKRADNDATPGSISAAVINDVYDAELVIADLTGFNPNAFYELGIRHTTGKPTIHMISERKRLPFDNLDQRTIFVDMSDYSDILAAKSSLTAAIAKVKESGYQVTNPVTQARGRAVLAASADPTEQIMADIANRLARVEAQVAAPPASSLREALALKDSDIWTSGVPSFIQLKHSVPMDEAAYLRLTESLKERFGDSQRKDRQEHKGKDPTD